MKTLTIAAAVIAVAIGTFIYHGVATLCDEDYWPDW
jgi:metal-dependent HD superfamily phosphatase/phosphodiesterase